MTLKTLLERRHGECAFPLLDGPEQLYCGEAVAARRAYCPEHTAVVYSGARPIDEAYYLKKEGA